VSISPKPTEMDPKLSGNVNLTGMNLPHFYLVNLIVPNQDSILKPGMTGYARVYGRRRSALGLAWVAISDFWGRKLW